MTSKLQVKTIQAQRVLNPTSIDLGEAVINPYKGCELDCVYCYVKTNRVTANHPEPWGSYVDVRINSVEQLEKELKTKKISTVLLGSTTELFQPIEKQYHLTQKILEVLNQHGIYYVILTRSTDVLNALPLLRQGFCKKIYFTVNLFDTQFKRVLEPKSPDFRARAKAIHTLMDHGITVVTYFCPVLPWISDLENAFKVFSEPKWIEFEFLNFTLQHIDEVIQKISIVNPVIGEQYKQMQNDKAFYDKVWQEQRKTIETISASSGKKFWIFEHQYNGFFENRYHDVKL